MKSWIPLAMIVTGFAGVGCQNARHRLQPMSASPSGVAGASTNAKQAPLVPVNDSVAASSLRDIANSVGHSDHLRRRAVFELFRRYAVPKMTLGDLRRLLGDPTWLTNDDIVLVGVVFGPIPVEFKFEDTIFVLTVLPRSEVHKSGIFFRVSGEVSLEAVRTCLIGSISEEPNCNIVIEEFGYAPAENSPPPFDSGL